MISKNWILGISLLFCFLFSELKIYAQNAYMISDLDSLTTCGAWINNQNTGGVYDNLCSDTLILNSPNGEKLILYFDEFSTADQNDYLMVYQGGDNWYPVYGHASGNQLENNTVFVDSSFVKLIWVSNESLVSEGFNIYVTCGQDCQDFTIDLTNAIPDVQYSDYNFIQLCPEEVANFSTTGNYPNTGTTYTQADSLVNWIWTIRSNFNTDIVEGKGMNNISYQFNEPGGYELCVSAIDSNYCMASNTTHVIISDTVIVGDPIITNIQNDFHPNRSAIKIFPNPTKGKFSIAAECIESVEVVNLQGKQIYLGKEKEIDLRNEPTGVYFIRVTTDNEIITRKLIKN